jgi:N-acetylated-alpha-linked acidic dipeptidase
VAAVGAGWESRQRSSWAQQTPVDLDAGEDAKFFARLSPLGSGSDYTAFIDHLGIPSWDFGFSGGYGVYHSVYDNFRWMEKYGDPGFHYHAAAARLWGLMAMRLANADVVPLRFSTYARDIQVDLDNLRRDAIRRARPPARMRSPRSLRISRRSSPRSRSSAQPVKPPMPRQPPP